MIICDIDNTLCDLNSLLKEKYNVSLTSYPDPKTEKYFQENHNNCLKVLVDAKPIPGAAKAIKYFSSIIKIMYVTCRQKGTEFITELRRKAPGFSHGDIRHIKH